MIPDTVKPALTGDIPGNIISCSRKGIPNVTYVSQVQWLNTTQVAVSGQFLNKTLLNIKENPFVTAVVTNPETFQSYRMKMKHASTEIEGAVFNSLKKNLAEIAARTGMEEIFNLKSAEIFDVIEVETVAGMLETN